MAGKMANAEETSGSSVAQVEGDIHIDPSQVSRSIYVTGYKPTTKSEDLIIHFQRTRNGGGDIDNIIVSKRGAAVITFDSPEVVKSVLQKIQEFQGGALTVKPYEESMKMDNHDYQVFEVVSAELCLETVEILTRGQTKTLLDEIAGKTGIRWIETSETFSMSGDFMQVACSRTYLQQAINQSGGIAVFSGLKRKMRQRHKNDENESQFNRDENDGGLNHASTTANALHNGVPSQDHKTHKTQSGHAAYATPPVIQYFEVEPKFIKVFVKAHKPEVNGIEADYHVEVPREAKGGKINLIPKDGCSSAEYDKACDLFIDLYQQMTQAMKMERFSLKCEIGRGRSKIHEMSKMFPVFVELSRDQKHWELYGEEHHIDAALEFLRKEEIEIKRESGKEKVTEEFQVSRHDEEAMDVDPPGSQSNGPLETYIGKFKVSVYKGDLTSERVDVIVNPSNNRLQHEGGMAKAILDKGGKVVEVESNKIIAKRKLLKDGEAVITDSGYLPCEKLVHAVGPDFRRVGLPQSRILLRQACLNSLIIANECKMTSIALPAMGSGTCGMPKDECAKVMFDAVEEFIKQRNPKKKTITDIRFVNIDDLSVQAFSMVFMTRYGNSQDHSDSKKLAGGSSIKVPPHGAGSSSVPSSRSDRARKNKTKQSPGNGQIATNPRSVLSSQQHNPIGNTNASAGHSLGVSNQSNTSYSGAVRKTLGAGNDARSFTAKDPGGEGKPGFHRGHSTDRKFVDSAAGGAGAEAECPICLDTVRNARTLKCKHVFCTDCVETALKHNNRCPVCKEVQGVIKGNQPKGNMNFYKSGVSLPGNYACGTITINYNFPSGIQGPEHPNPGQRYGGTQRTAYLPDNREGNEVLQLLRRAFDARLVFTVGTSVTTGWQNQITWNDIHHKTSMSGGPQCFGYPDPDYLKRVKEDLAAKGIR